MSDDRQKGQRFKLITGQIKSFGNETDVPAESGRQPGNHVLRRRLRCCDIAIAEDQFSAEFERPRCRAFKAQLLQALRDIFSE